MIMAMVMWVLIWDLLKSVKGLPLIARNIRSGPFRTYFGQLLSNRYFTLEKWGLSPFCTLGFYQQSDIQVRDPSTRKVQAVLLVKYRGCGVKSLNMMTHERERESETK